MEERKRKDVFIFVSEQIKKRELEFPVKEDFQFPDSS